MEKFCNKAVVASNYSKLFWNEWQINPDNAGYNMGFIYSVEGDLDVNRLISAIKCLVAENPVYRSSFQQNADGSLVQLFSDNIEAGINYEDYTLNVDQIDGLIKKTLNDKFDLEKPPLFRFLIVKKKFNRYIIVINFHHIILDGNGICRLITQISNNYNSQRPASAKNKKHIEKFSKYKEFEDKLLGTQNGDYWINLLADRELYTELPINSPSAVDSVNNKPDFKLFDIQHSLLEKLNSFSTNTKTSIFQIITAVWSILIYRYTKNSSFIMTYPVDCRPKEFSDIDGCLVNTVPCIVDIKSGDSFRVLIESLKNQRRLTRKHQQYPLLNIINDLKKVGCNPQGFNKIFNLGIAQTSNRLPDLELDNLTTAGEPSQILASYEMLFEFWINSHNTITCQIMYDSNLFDKDFIELIPAHFHNILESCLLNQECSISDIDYISSKEKNLILEEWNKGYIPFQKNKTIHQLFEEQVKLTPEKTALVYKGSSLSFAELNKKSNQLAKYIRNNFHRMWEREIKGDDLIGIYLDRGLELIISILGVLKAGAAYVPFDKADPKNRLEFKVNDSECKMVLTQNSMVTELLFLLQQDTIPIALDSCWDDINAFSSDNISNKSKSSDLAYIIYTSGSTGKPKGVMIEHYSVINLISSLSEVYDYKDQQRKSTFFTSHVFDVSVSEIFASLLYGGELHIFPDEIRKNPDDISNYIALNHINYVYLPPAMLALLPDNEFSELTTVIYAGEPCDRKTAEKWSSKVRLFNMYGPTECTIYCIGKQVFKGEVNEIGKPLQNYKAYVLDENLMQVPPGITGELHIAGEGLARGYLKRDSLTKEKFIKNPYATKTDKQLKRNLKLYKTGDLVRWKPDGNLEYIGRNDNQIKLHGYRIELGEIEAKISLHPNITQSVVLCKERNQGKYLVAYYTSDEEIQEEEVNSFISELLPDYMVPSVFIQIDAFHLNASGKIDRKILPEPEFENNDKYIPPESNIEHKLCEFWQEVLNIKKVGITDDFFRLGGDSILSIQLSSKLRQAGINISVKDIFEHRTITKLAKLSALENINTINVEKGILEGQFELLPIQQWFFEKKYQRENHWNQSFLIKVPKLDINKLNSILSSFVDHHDSLRLTFKDQYYQTYNGSINIPNLKVIDRSDICDEELNEIFTDWQSNFNIKDGPLWSIGYVFGYEDNSARIFLAANHLIMDSVSWRIIIEDLKSLYEGRKIPDKTSSYRQWVESAKSYADFQPGEVTYWEKVIDKQADYSKLANTSSNNVIAKELVFDTKLTEDLLKNTGHAYNTEINDILLTALAYTLKEFHGEDQSFISLEGHGREDINNEIDISRTVGWFTTIYPVKLTIKDTISATVKTIKETLRNIPNKGIGFGIFKYLKKSEALVNASLPLVTFNYLGQFDSSEGFWQLSSEPSGNCIDNENYDSTLLTINGKVVDSKLSFMFNSRLNESSLELIALLFKKNLEKIIYHCKEKEYKDFTPSDFSGISISIAHLDKLQKDYRIDNILLANSLQKGFIFHAITFPDDDAYRVQFIFNYEAEIDVNLYKKAWEFAVLKYPALRLCFDWKDEFYQIICKECRLNFSFIDLEGTSDTDKKIEEIITQDRADPFNLNVPPLFRIYLIKEQKNKYKLLFSEHHSIGDGWSWPILFDFVHSSYNSLSKGKLLSVDEDTAYSNTQKFYLHNKKNVDEYWQNKLKSFTQANDLNCFTRERIDLDSVKSVETSKDINLVVESNIYEKLKFFAKETGVTINVLVQFSWHKLLNVYTSQNQTTVGTTVSGRNLSVENIDKSVGLFINTLPLIVDWENDCTVNEQLSNIHKLITDMSNNSFCELASLQKGSQKLFHSLFAFENYPSYKNELSEKLNFNFCYALEKLDYPLGISAFEKNSELHINIKYAEELIDQAIAVDIVEKLKFILLQIPYASNKSHKSIKILTDIEYNQIIYDWNDTNRKYPDNLTLADLFREQALKTPNNIAVTLNEESLTYHELDVQSDRFAIMLRGCFNEYYNESLQADSLVGIYLERSINSIVAIIGIIKAGAAYVPFDVNDPPERTAFKVDDSNCRFIITSTSLKREAAYYTEKTNSKVIYIEKLTDKDIDESSQFKNPNTNAKDLAYVIYTSGSTGKPKGVMIEHRAILNFIDNYKKFFKSERPLKVLQSISLCFDASWTEIALGLFTGNTLVISRDMEKANTQKLIDTVKKEKIDIAVFPAAFLNGMDINEIKNLENLKYIIAGGDACNYKILDSISEFSSIVNAYGPTESSVCASMHFYDPKDKNTDIGRPLNNIKLYVLDENLNPVPVGVAGELYIGGESLARGYLNRKELTEERFINNPFASQEELKNKKNLRLYKTGDLVKWLPNGNIEFIGRNDDQVKIRGFRVELGEIEACFLKNSTVSQCCVMIYDNKNAGAKQLVLYYTSAEKITDHQKIRNYAVNLLPEYMVPSFYMYMEIMPLTVNGKIDKKALPLPEYSGERDNYTAPKNELEEELCKIWESSLGIKGIGITDDFFHVGGNSISALQVTHKISKVLNKQITAADLFECKTIEKLLDNIYTFESLQIEPSEIKEKPLSFAQERLFFIEQLEGGSNAYNIPFILNCSDKVDINKALECVNTIFSRHEVLRTVYKQNRESHDYYQQVLDMPLDIEKKTVADNKLNDIILQNSNKIFNLELEIPFKVWQYKTETQNIIHINVHHIAFDGWSADIFLNELEQLYAGNEVSKLDIQYSDFAVWQRKFLKGERLTRQVEFWKGHLNNCEQLRFPTDFIRPSSIDYSGDELDFSLGSELSTNLRNTAKELGVSLNSVLLAGFKIFLFRYCGQEDVLIGTPVANRQYSQIQGIIGFFVNSMPLRTILNKNSTVEDAVLNVFESLVQVQKYQDVPFEKLVDSLKIERDQSKHPLFQILFSTQNFGINSENKLFELKNCEGYKAAKFDLSVTVDDRDDNLFCKLNFATSLFTKGTIQRVFNYFKAVLTQIAQDRQVEIRRIQLISKTEYDLIVNQWNRTEVAYPCDLTAIECFEEQASKTPDKIALAYKDKFLTYKELNNRANQLAHTIREKYKNEWEQELKSNTLIGLYLNKGTEVIVGILGILKAGAAYVPFDTADPEERLRYKINDCGCRMILTVADNLKKLLFLSEIDTLPLCLDSYWKYIDKFPVTNPKLINTPDDLAYVIYTSGSTGKPKGVMLEHRNLINLICAQKAVFKFDNKTKVLQFASICFDASVWEIFAVLFYGGTLFMADEKIRKNPEQLHDYIDNNEITWATLPPAMLGVMPRKELQTLTDLVVAGDTCDASTVSYWSESRNFYNAYGPTESTVCASIHTYKPGDKNYNIGKPLNNIKLYILDEDLTPAPIGVPGELYIGGESLARGYLNRSSLTKERFIDNHLITSEDFKNNRNLRLYKTGDVAKWASNGDVEFIGRNDNQVKIRGFRIELGEVESCFLKCPYISNCCISVHENKDAGTKHLALYYTVSESSITVEDVRNYASSLLPEYMVPSFFVFMNKMPLTVNGKIDKKSLPDPVENSLADNSFVDPETETENTVTRIWMKLLELNKVSVEQDFFLIGGSSILAMKLVTIINETFDNLNIKVSDIFKLKTIRNISCFIDENSIETEEEYEEEEI